MKTFNQLLVGADVYAKQKQQSIDGEAYTFINMLQEMDALHQIADADSACQQ